MQDRVRLLNNAPLRSPAEYVLYWAQMNRRVRSNHGLVYAAQLANELNLPLLYYEGLTCTYDAANDRLHTFVLEGVPDTAERLKPLGIGYVFYLRRKRTDPNDVLYRLAEQAAAVITDDYPVFIAAKHNHRVPPKISVPYSVVDSSCVIPMNKWEKREYAAYTIRPKVRKLLPQYLQLVAMPALRQRFPARLPEALAQWHTPVKRPEIAALVASCEIDHAVPPSLSFHGGAAEAERHYGRFLQENLKRYAAERNEPAAHATSDISPYLHFGHISSLEMVLQANTHVQETQMIADEYLEEVIVRRELAFNFARFSPRVDSLANLPEWARETLRQHAADQRQPVYSREQWERAETADPLWNAAQKELLLRGKIHGYYRMYWGKKVLEWSPTHQDALETLIYLHDRYALDGRDPNTYTNILWLFGLHDRPWQERPIFGKVRYMSYDGMRRKTDSKAYLEEIATLERTGRDPYAV